MNKNANCYILNVGKIEKEKLKEIMVAITGKIFLTASEPESFTTSGGIVRFITKQSKIKLQTNLSASQTAALNISSKLLGAAEIVN